MALSVAHNANHSGNRVMAAPADVLYYPGTASLILYGYSMCTFLHHYFEPQCIELRDL